MVLAQQYRNGPEVLKRCLLLTLLYLIKTVEIENSFATCSPALGRLYRRFGFSVVAKDACAGIGDPFSLIHGRVSDVLRALTENEPESLRVTCS